MFLWWAYQSKIDAFNNIAAAMETVASDCNNTVQEMDAELKEQRWYQCKEVNVVWAKYHIYQKVYVLWDDDACAATDDSMSGDWRLFKFKWQEQHYCMTEEIVGDISFEDNGNAVSYSFQWNWATTEEMVATGNSAEQAYVKIMKWLLKDDVDQYNYFSSYR